MKKFVVISLVGCMYSVTFQPVKAQRLKDKVVFSENTVNGQTFRFIDGIEVRNNPVSSIEITKPVAEVVRGANTGSAKGTEKDFEANIESASSIQFKYAQIINCNVETIRNISLYRFIDEWMGTRYRYGGSTSKGIDCSSLAGLLIQTVYHYQLPRTCREQYYECTKVDRSGLQEGDLVFFNTRGGVSHVGVYLAEGTFVHASRKNGVIISRLDDPYYDRHFISAGRIPKNNSLAE